jgi:hypothetical protein
MAKFLKQSTAAHIMFGPFLDKTDGVSLEVAAGIITSIDHASTGIFLSKEGGAGAIRHPTVTASVLDAYGMFQVHLDTTDTNTVGNLRVMMAEAATFLPVWDDYTILPANVYDSLMGTDLLDVNSAQVLGTAIHAASENGTQCVEVVRWGGNDIAATAVNGVPKVALTHVNAAAQTATLDTIKAETVEILTDTAVIGALGAGLTALATAAELTKVPKSDSTVTFNATALADVKLQATNALVDINLDHLAKTVTATADMTTELADNTILSRILANGDTSAFNPTTDGLQLIRDKLPTNLEDLAVADTTGLVSVGTLANNVITAAAIADAAIDNATFASDVGSTAFATNIVALAVFKALDSAITDAVSLTAGGLLEKVRKLTWVLTNKIEVTDANGNTVVYKDDSTTAAYTVNAALVDNSTTTTRLRMA